jgi:hypothetical protein
MKALAGALVLSLVFSSSVFAKGNWKLNNGKWNLVDGDGTMAKGWQFTGGHWYNLGSDGTMQTGWLHEGSHWYLLNGDGAMETGWQKVSNKWYYMYGDGSMASNTTVQGYKVNTSGEWVDNSTSTSSDSTTGTDTASSTTDTSTSPETATSTIDLSTGTETTSTDTASTDNTSTTGTTTGDTSTTDEDSNDGTGKITKDQLAAIAVEMPADAVVNGMVQPSLVPQDGKVYHFTETVKHGKGQGQGEIATYDCYYKYVSTVGTKGGVLKIAFKVHNTTDDTENTQQ